MNILPSASLKLEDKKIDSPTIHLLFNMWTKHNRSSILLAVDVAASLVDRICYDASYANFSFSVDKLFLSLSLVTSKTNRRVLFYTSRTWHVVSLQFSHLFLAIDWSHKNSFIQSILARTRRFDSRFSVNGLSSRSNCVCIPYL